MVIIFRIAPAGSEQPGFFEAMWLSLMRTLDSGTMGGDEGTGFRATMLFVTLGGIFIVSSLIGVINSGIEAKLEELRKGRSFVVEKDHTLILGWSPKIFTILSELVQANENRQKPRVVILADKDKVEMEDEIAEKVPDTGKTRIVCRTGSPLDLYDPDRSSGPGRSRCPCSAARTASAWIGSSMIRTSPRCCPVRRGRCGTRPAPSAGPAWS